MRYFALCVFLITLLILGTGCTTTKYQKQDIISLDDNPNSLWYVATYDSQSDIYGLVQVSKYAIVNTKDQTRSYGYKPVYRGSDVVYQRLFGDVLIKRNARLVDHSETPLFNNPTP